LKEIKKILIYSNYQKDKELLVTEKLKNYIVENGGSVKIAADDSAYENDLIKRELIDDAECIIVLGGDGTMLRAAHVMGDSDIPLIGVNLGTLGFLTEIDTCHMEKMVKRLISGDYDIEERMLLDTETKKGHSISLNDVVIYRTGILRLIAIKISVNDKFLDTYEADGVIISTPTGSTGYNLSAGGPIVNPTARLIVITPISPHSLSKKSIILDPNDEISIEILEKRKTQENEAIISFDGYENYELSVKDVVKIKASNKTVKLIKMYDKGFYEILRSKVI